MKKIGVITALSAEGKQLEAVLGKPVKTDLYGNFSIKTYINNGHEIYFAKSGVGEILASACTQLLIDLYKVDLVVNYGLAGGYKTRNMGEAVLITGAVHYDFDTSAIDDCAPGHYLDLFDGPIIDTDENLRDFALKISPSISQGVLASGDKFVTEENFKEHLYQTYGATVYDMEGVAILIICKTAKIPALIVKVISDSGNKDEFYTFKDMLKDAKTGFITLMKNIIDNL